MNPLPDDTKSIPPLDYANPASSSVGCLVGAIVFATCVGGLAVFILRALATSDSKGEAAFLFAGLTVLTTGAFVARKFGMSAALAITLASVCVGILLFGMCANELRGS